MAVEQLRAYSVRQEPTEFLKNMEAGIRQAQAAGESSAFPEDEMDELERQLKEIG